MDARKLEHTLTGEVILGNGCHRRLKELCALGTRFAGSPGEKLAQDYITDRLRSCGLRPEFEPFKHLAWKRGTARLEIVEPVHRQLLTISLAGAPSTPPEGIVGEILFLGNGTPREFEQFADSIEDRIVLVSSLSPRAECSPPRQCHRRTKYGRAVAYGARAFLFMNSQPGMLPQTGSTRQNSPGEIPAVTIPFEEGAVLRHHLAKGPVSVRLHVENEAFENLTGNIVAEIPGARDDEVVIVGGHYDCHDISHGALDNGMGVALLLELARILSEAGVRFRKTLRFVFFGVEEMASVGSSFYVAQHHRELDAIDLFINVDGIGQLGGKTYDTQGFGDVSRFILDVAKQTGYEMKIPNPAFSGDSIAFVIGGVPTAALRSSRTPGMFGYLGTTNGEDRGWGHTPADTIDKVPPHAFYEPAIVLARTVIRAAGHEGRVAGHKSKAEVAALLDHHGMSEVLRYMKWPTIDIRPGSK